MDKKFQVTCPDCGSVIQIVLSEAGTISVSFLDSYSDEEKIQIAREIGFELGEKGGANG